MPFYRITIYLNDKSVHTAIRHLDLMDVDVVWRLYYSKAKSYYKNKLFGYSAVQLSKLDPEVKEWIKNQAKRDDPPNWVNDDYEIKPKRGKSSGFEGRQLGERES